jgi:hypothetical protein
MMKAARLKGDLLSRKGAARPVPGVGTRHHSPAGHPRLPVLAAVDPGSAKQKLKRDKFGRARVSLRLDPHRHLRLKLLSAHNRTSLQETLIAALDAYLGDEAQSVNSGNCDCLQESGDPPQGGGRPRAAGAAGIKDAE